jgi:NitT/TauT family transport system substrate-binding protein
MGAALALLALNGTAGAADKLRVGKGGNALLYEVIEIGQAAGIWAKLNLDPTSIQFDGEAPLEKAFASGDIDIGLGSGTSLAYRLKGVPQTGVAVMSEPPYDFAVGVDPDSPYRKVADLKGKSIGVTSRGSLTDYLVHEASRQEGWGDDGMKSEGILSTPARMAAMKKGDLQGVITTPETGFDYEEHGQMRILFFFGDVVKNFITHTIMASDKLIKEHPDQVQRFLKGWYQTVAYMKQPEHKAESVKIIADVMKISMTAATRAFDVDLKALSDDGHFDQAKLDVVRNALPGFGILDYVPAAKDLYNPNFTPVSLK